MKNWYYNIKISDKQFIWRSDILRFVTFTIISIMTLNLWACKNQSYFYLFFHCRNLLKKDLIFLHAIYLIFHWVKLKEDSIFFRICAIFFFFNVGFKRIIKNVIFFRSSVNWFFFTEKSLTYWKILNANKF